MQRRRMQRRILFAANLLCGVALSAVQPSTAFAQRPGAPPSSGRGNTGGPVPMQQQTATLLVSVRETTGMPLSMGAIVKLGSYAGSLHMTSVTQDTGTATFSDVPAGDYNVEVSASGYQNTKQLIEVMGGMTNYTVYVYVQPESATGTPTAPGTIMAPRLQAEIDRALEKMRKEQYDAARQHLEKAAKMAPANADIAYLLGMLEYKQEHLEAARAKFQAAVALNPSHERACVALADLQLRAGQPQEAAQTLEKAYQQNGADWRLHYILARAYAAQKLYEKAETHAARALELSKSDGARAQLLLGRIQAAEGKTEEATRTFETLIRESPKEGAAQEARTELTALESRVRIAATNKTVPADNAVRSAPEPPVLAAIPIVVRPWAPPDIDAKEYPVALDAACSLDQVLHRTQLRSAKQLTNFERFAATEHIIHQEVDANGMEGTPRARDFDYLVLVQRLTNGSFFLEEERDGGQNLNEFPTHLASTGLVSLGVSLFEEDFQKDLTFGCEGLGKWRGQAAWQIRFEQRKEVASRLRSWRNGRGTFRVPLKGRVWVSANTYDVLHLETDLREPQPDIQLQRDHLIIDYGQVNFERAGVSLWLPWYAEMFMEVHGKRYHHRHTLTNYTLFSVDTKDKISLPSGGTGLPN
jgi:tetratricopeptide (TPR) repeat protein